VFSDRKPLCDEGGAAEKRAHMRAYTCVPSAVSLVNAVVFTA
jgi:hypothetical protein